MHKLAEYFTIAFRARERPFMDVKSQHPIEYRYAFLGQITDNLIIAGCIGLSLLMWALSPIRTLSLQPRPGCQRKLNSGDNCRWHHHLQQDRRKVDGLFYRPMSPMPMHLLLCRRPVPPSLPVPLIFRSQIPPVPLRTFAVPQNGDPSARLDASTSYPTSVVDPPQAQVNINSGEKLRETTDGLSSSSGPRQRPDAPPKSPIARTPSTSSHYQFASASFSACTPNRSSGFSSSSSASASARSALSIAEIDCFFVQGSRSSVRSAARSNSSSQSQPPSAEGSGDVWTSDEAERERQREERKAFMKARHHLREEARRRKRISAGGPTENTEAATWREAIQAQAVMPLKGIPESRAGSSRGVSTSGSPRGLQHPKPPAGPLVDTLRTPPLPSGPGPPPKPEMPVDTLADTLSECLIVSDAIPQEQKSDQDSTPPADGTHPTLNRFDSDDTAVAIPVIISTNNTPPS
ncbi:hypothetical protein OPQ81_005864 [Rhizoctonia solani]|nr:hypothetical protein OPQ81_005864 [Rhizoctonia solani]